MRGTRLTLLSLVVLAALACSGGGGPTVSTRSEPDAIAVTVATAVVAPMPTRVSLVGGLVAARQVMVAADANGVIVETRVERGQSVKRGDPLVVVDTRSGRYSADASSAQSAAQRAQAEVADKECQRAESLFAQGVISAAQIERSRAACEAQRAVSAAASASASAASAVSRAVVRAPFDGTVGERLVELGAFVGSASPVASVYTRGPLRVRVAVPEVEIGKVMVGSSVVVALSEAGGAGRSVTGRVVLVSGALREQTRDLVVEAELDAEDDVLWPGMFVRVDLEVGELPVVVLPTEAIRKEGTLARVFLVREGRAFETVVRLGTEQGQQVGVLAGVEAGDQVVLQPPDSIRDGQRVSIGSGG